jgi:ABC-type phosphate/phosphonate transport system permease subunit
MSSLNSAVLLIVRKRTWQRLGVCCIRTLERLVRAFPKLAMISLFLRIQEGLGIYPWTVTWSPYYDIRS